MLIMEELLLPLIYPPSKVARLSPEEQFKKYDHENPQVYEAFRQIAVRLMTYYGRSHYGAKAIMEQIRLETVDSGNDDFKINNNYTSRYARKLIEEQPRFKDFFRLRELRTK